MDVRSITTSAALSLPGTTGPTAADGANSFGQLLAGAVESLQRSQGEADALSSSLAAGEDVDLHEVMLALEQANLATQLTVQVRNKLVEAYQEIARMQI